MQNPKLVLKRIDMKEGEGLTIRHGGSDIRSIFITAGHSDLTVTGMQNRNSRTYRYHVMGVDEVKNKSSINDRILNCLYSYRLNNGKKEKSLYLGRNEISDLSQWIYDNNVESEFWVKDVKDVQKCLGMIVHTVMADNHMVIV